MKWGNHEYRKEEVEKWVAGYTYKSLNLSMKTYCGLRFESEDGLWGIQPEYLTTSSYLSTAMDVYGTQPF